MRPHATFNHAIALTLLVAVALAGGMVAFLVSQPGSSTRVESGQLGFRSLDRAWIADRFANVARTHRAAATRQAQTAASAKVARRWLAALPTNATPTRSATTRTAIAPTDDAARRRIAALRQWANGIDAAMWNVTIVNPSHALAEDDSAWVVDGVMSVRVASAKQRVARARVPVSLELAAPVEGGRTWRIRDVHVDGPATGLRAFVDPTTVHGEAIDVIVPASLASDASTIAHMANRSLASLRRDLGDHASIDTLAIRGWDNVAQLRALVGARRAVGIDDRSTPLVAVDADGDVLVHAPTWKSSTPAQRSGVLRAALFRTATADTAGELPAIVRDGVARALAGALTREELQLVASTTGRSVGELLLAKPNDELAGDAELARAHVFGTWLLEQHGLAAVGSMIDARAARLPAEQVVRRVLHATSDGVAARIDDSVAQTLDTQVKRTP